MFGKIDHSHTVRIAFSLKSLLEIASTHDRKGTHDPELLINALDSGIRDNK